MNAASRCFLALRVAALAAVWPLATSSAAPAPANSSRTVPELFAGELEDVGPQFLLLAAARPRPMELWTDVEFSTTSNATLVERDPKSSSLTSAQAGGTWHFGERTYRGGQLRFETGFKVQTYRYGLLVGTKEKINFLEIDRNNFDLHGAHVQAGWRAGGATDGSPPSRCGVLRCAIGTTTACSTRNSVSNGRPTGNGGPDSGRP